MALPVVKVYNPSGSVVGTAVGDDVNEVKSYVTQANGGSRHARASACVHGD